MMYINKDIDEPHIGAISLSTDPIAMQVYNGREWLDAVQTFLDAPSERWVVFRDYEDNIVLILGDPGYKIPRDLAEWIVENNIGWHEEITGNDVFYLGKNEQLLSWLFLKWGS